MKDFLEKLFVQIFENEAVFKAFEKKKTLKNYTKNLWEPDKKRLNANLINEYLKMKFTFWQNSGEDNGGEGRRAAGGGGTKCKKILCNQIRNNYGEAFSEEKRERGKIWVSK